jgi:ArsR family transcriptional regulator, arsenate/arsenite/antimonite-responsive transcriptional repressor
VEQSKALAALSALANETRLDLVRRLIVRGEKGMCAGGIALELGMSASRLSFHLAALEQAGLVSARRESRHIIYAVDHRSMGGLIGYLLNDCCKADPKVSACCAGHLTAQER